MSAMGDFLAARPACSHERATAGATGAVETCFHCEAMWAVSYVDNHVLSSLTVQDDIAHSLYDLTRDKRMRYRAWEDMRNSDKKRWMDMAATAMVTILHHDNLLDSIR